jgi:hypothetical protein
MTELSAATEELNPDFLIIGAAKAATTSLAIMLREHPDVAFSRIKEPHFFSVPNKFALGWPWYRGLYAHKAPGNIIGEASTSYSRIRTYPKVIGRIHRYLPEVKIIYLVRNPLDRIRSAYIERLSEPGFGQAHPSLSEALRQIPAMIDSSRHYEVYSAYREKFPAENIRVIWFEELVEDPNGVFRDLCSFLGIRQQDPIPVEYSETNSQEHVEARINRMGRSIEGVDLNWSEEAIQFVFSAIGDDIKQFLDFFGKPGDYWLDQ